MLAYAILGLLVGAAVNHAADTLPHRRSLLEAPHCPDCERPLSPWQWISLVAFLSGHRRCPDCEAVISWRHPITELVTAFFFGFLWQRYEPSLQLWLFSIYVVLFILIFIIDLEHRLILNVIIYPSIFVAIVSAFFRPDISYLQSLVGGVANFVLVFLIFMGGPLFLRLWNRLKGQSTDQVPFGFGDVKLAMFIGLVIGFPGTIFALVIGILAGGVGALLFILIRLLGGRRYAALTAIPYGPFLIFGALVMLLHGQTIMESYLGIYT
jgi:leader peptidase (prepilin peptidase)/N-methyltransferase